MSPLLKIIAIPFCLLTYIYTVGQQPKELTAFVAFATFHQPGDTPYVEIYTTVLGNSLRFVQTEEQKFKADFSISLTFKQQNKVVKVRTYNYSTPLLDDTSKYFTLQDVYRIKLPVGSYQATILFNDLNASQQSITYSEEIIIDYDDTRPSISGIQLIEKYNPSDNQASPFWKSGYEIQPYPINFYPKHIDKMTFYLEIYHIDKLSSPSDVVYLQAYISQFETKKILNNYAFFRRLQMKPFVGFIYQFDIRDLPSGNYLLHVLLKNDQNETITQNQLFFQRSNPPVDQKITEELLNNTNLFAYIKNPDTLREYVYCLRPIATEIEKHFIDTRAKTADVLSLQQFLAAFWSSRSPEPLEAMRAYMTEVEKVNNTFSTRNKKGYETDRGRVYLQYGPPNSIVSQTNEPNAYPYEIWHYYELNNQRNRKFVFYNRTLATNDYELLHSDAIGEPRDPQWQVKIHQRNFATNDPDLERSDWGWGSKVDELWRNPR